MRFGLKTLSGWIHHFTRRHCGYAIVSNARFAELRELAFYKPSSDIFLDHLRRIFKMYNISCVLDVGASEGLYAESLRRDLGYEGWIHSFEPLPGRHEALAAKVAKDPRWVLHKCALGSTSGEAELNVTSLDVFSSFLAPDSNQSGKYADSNCVVQRVKVPVRTVAEVLPEILASSGPGAVYLKMDTQGFDLEVFRGAAGVLEQIVALQSELALKTIYAQAPDWQVMMRELIEAGYQPSFFLPISFDKDLSIIEADGIFVRAPEELHSPNMVSR